MQAITDDFEDMVKAGYPRVFKYALRLSGDRQEAADVTQDTFLRAYRARSRNPVGRRPDGWLFRIAYHCFLDSRRRLKSLPRETSLDAQCESNDRFDPADPAPDPEQAFLSDELSIPMTKALAALSDEQRSLMHLAHFGELSHQELSEILGCGATTVKTRIHRAHLVLKRQLAALGFDSAATCRHATI